MKDLDALRTDLAKRILQLPPTSYYQSEPWVVIALAIIVEELDRLKGAVAAEREACAKVADGFIGPEGHTLSDGDDGLLRDGANWAAQRIAAIIRERKQ